VGGAQMTRHGAKGHFVGGRLVATVEHELKMYWSPTERALSLDGQPVRRVADYYGRMRCVVFCAEDLQLVKGTPRGRRRFLDFLLAQTEPGYLGALQRYARALQSRNALLKRPNVDAGQLATFTRELVASGEILIRRRRELTPKLSALARLAYRRISNDAEDAQITYAPSAREDFAVELAQSAARERALRMTVVGPHRDDLTLQLGGKAAAQFASEGQKRSLAIALKIAQAEYQTGKTGSPPILLIDDVMGELDARRRAGLMPILERADHARGQVFMTCTEENWPRELARRAQRWEVKAATLRPLPQAG
jgi:DNA replication and repair protein RecF